MSSSSDRITLVTGGAMGIGAAIAEQLARVLVSDLKLEEAEKTAERFREAGHSAHPVELDVGQPASINAAFEHIATTYGRCDVLVNNAGIANTFPFIEFPLDTWLATLNINLTGTLLCSQYAARLMSPKRWGRIINIASVAGMRAVGKRADCIWNL